MRSGGKLVKNVTGYDLLHLLVGSEGTPAGVTQITLRLIPLPPARVDLLVPFDRFPDVARAVTAILEARVVPAAIEFMQRDSVLACQRLLGKELPFNDAAAHLLIQFDGRRKVEVDALVETVAELCLEHGARDLLMAADSRTRDRLWEARRAIIDALNHESPVNHMEDVTVPRAQIAALLAGMQDMSQRNGVRMVPFGHAGDGNVHVTVLKDHLAGDRWQALLPPLREELNRLTLALDEAQIAVMRRIRQAFDPNGILNPGKIFP